MRDDDFKWFIENYDGLFKKYGHKYLSIKDKQILGVYNDVVSAIETTSKKHTLGTFIVQECNGDQSAYTTSITTFEILK